MSNAGFDKKSIPAGSFPVYPKKLRKYARIILRIRYLLLFLLVLGPVLLAIGIKSEPQNIPMIYAGIFLILPGGLFFETIHARNGLINVDIRDDGVHILDEKGESFRSAEYRYIRKIETQTFQVTEISSEVSKRQYPPVSGVEAKFILIYINGAACFDDLKLRQLGKKGKNLYWCDRLFYHPDCIAFVYSDAAWKLLQERMNACFS